MDKDPKVFLRHILGSIEDLDSYTKGVSHDVFMASREKQDAVVRRLEVIGEAVKNLPNEFREKNADIPWKKIAGMRDELIHEYFSVDLELVWATVADIVPEFKKQVQRMLKGVK